MTDFRNNHYVPQWFQRNFLPQGTGKFWYLDLHPERVTSGTRTYTRANILRWGPPRCFCQLDLYTTSLGDWRSVDIERHFFGRIDREGQRSLEYIRTFEHPSVDGDAFENALTFMSLQKLRTPKGLAAFSEFTRINHRNRALSEMQALQNLFGAVWTEAVWALVEAKQSPTKFLLSDHPITVYNSACPPASHFCRDHRDPDVRHVGSHTIFPLGLERALILTNLSWVRDPYQDPLAMRPNPRLFGSTVFNFLKIQTGRDLTETEVCEINYIIKSRARRYVAAAERDWLFPEEKLRTLQWESLGGGYLLFPDPRSMTFSGEVMMKYSNGRSEAFDEHGRRPGQPSFRDQALRDREWNTHLAFQGEYARVFGPARRGRSFEYGRQWNGVDDPEFHAYHLGLEVSYKPARHSRVKRRRPPNE